MRERFSWSFRLMWDSSSSLSLTLSNFLSSFPFSRYFLFMPIHGRWCHRFLFVSTSYVLLSPLHASYCLPAAFVSSPFFLCGNVKTTFHRCIEIIVYHLFFLEQFLPSLNNDFLSSTTSIWLSVKICLTPIVIPSLTCINNITLLDVSNQALAFCLAWVELVALYHHRLMALLQLIARNSARRVSSWTKDSSQIAFRRTKEPSTPFTRSSGTRTR